jgi:adenosylcobyric acid synthase
MRQNHGGNIKRIAKAAGLPEAEIIDFSANINPLGPPEWLRPLVSAAFASLAHYPDPGCEGLHDAVKARYGIPEEETVVGNGSSEILYWLPRALKAKRAVIPVPAYADYETASHLAGLVVEKIILKEENGFLPDMEAIAKALRGDEIVFLGHPNNPTGLICDADAVRGIARKNPSTVFVIDEAFSDFVDGFDSFKINRAPNIVVLYSLTKFYAIPGLRLGLTFADRSIAARIKEVMPPWSVNRLAQLAGEKALSDSDYDHRTRDCVRRGRDWLCGKLHSIPCLKPVPGRANFLLVRIERTDISAPLLAEKLLPHGIAIRLCGNFDGLDDRYFRVAVRTEEENEKLYDALCAVLRATPKTAVKRHKPAVMFQGTSSNAGKSVLAAAFCRILLQDGYDAAPFKAQNMSLNSFVTRDGGEMGRAQVVQAQACRLDPDVRMNPVLLKPNSETGSQVIVMGKPVANMDVARYIRYKAEAFATVKEAYDALAAEHDVMVLEGAGSPAEINLKSHDMVNMNMARYAASPVVIVGDIDRGGVFASFVGTMELMEEWERKLVAGFVINRFRGDASLLDSAIDYTLRHTERPTFGVVPYLPDLGLPEEDSVTFKNLRQERRPARDDYVEIALIDLPHISNFTDFDALRAEPDVFLRIVRTPRELGNPDAVILPGSKNVMADIGYLTASGLAGKLSAIVHGKSAEVIGVCGGFQIIGSEIADPHGIESSGRTAHGLGFLPVTTVLARDKTLERVTARHVESGHTLHGYEIHHGRTNSLRLPAAVIKEDGRVLGVQSDDGLVWGTYLHGLFDADGFRRWFVDRLRKRRNLSPLGTIVAAYSLEAALDRLADVVRAGLNVREIYRIMGLA